MKIAVLPGDGIGPEITEVAKKIVEAVADKFNHSVSFEYGSCGADAIDKYGNPYPEETHALCKNSDAVP